MCEADGAWSSEPEKAFYSLQPSPIGDLVLIGDGIALTELYLPGSPQASTLPVDAVRQAAPFRQVALELEAYFAGRADAVRRADRAARYTISAAGLVGAAADPIRHHRDLRPAASQLNHSSAARAVGLANGRNPIPIIIPCHRLIGAGGSLVGYGGGLERKRWLLDLEARGSRVSVDSAPGCLAEVISCSPSPVMQHSSYAPFPRR